ncbi:hypothetical protein F4824DRAFT_444646 [Ustulina deusta]|nr:hypothetical protein F4824DRAFT_444646 [Ustulina deusta]
MTSELFVVGSSWSQLFSGRLLFFLLLLLRVASGWPSYHAYTVSSHISFTIEALRSIQTSLLTANQSFKLLPSAVFMDKFRPAKLLYNLTRRATLLGGSHLLPVAHG